ncbi:ABC transporter ATP-binding protein [Tsukamurella soli]|uniref:ABC transporter ATP-binding protein n=1 Tax=Tsukamurella soli TaxID=644556 RepID=A0ABP8K8I1_9ACTN
MSAIDVSGVHKSYGATPVLRGVDLEVPESTITAILGRSGSGKTTLLRAIAGFERLDAGRISIGGTVVDDGSTVVAAQRRGIGYVPQDGALFPHLRVRANVGFGLRRRDTRRGSASTDRVDELLELLGLTGLERRFPHQLSGGQRQRVALARALAPRPSVVLLDEPFSSLDAALRASLRVEIARVLRTAGATAVVVTHDRDEALSMADQVAVLHEGRLVAAGAPRELYERPADAATARFLGVANLLPATVTGGRVQCAVPGAGSASEGTPPDGATGAADGRYLYLLRPEQLTITDEPTAHGIPATVESVVYEGATSRVHVRTDGDGTDLTVLTRSSAGGAVGSRVWVDATAQGVLLPAGP